MRKIDLFIHQLSSLFLIQAIFGKLFLNLNVVLKLNPPKNGLLSAKSGGLLQIVGKQLLINAFIRQCYSQDASRDIPLLT